MPDSLPPSGWGPPPFDERDLDALLSGETTGNPDYRRVEDTLAALRAAPTRAELRGEATIMAEFDALAEFAALGLSQAAPPDGMSHTLVLPVPPPGAPRRRGARHRNRRPAPSVSKRTAAILIAAAAALVVAAVAVTGNLPGLHNGSPRQTAAASSAAASNKANSASGSLELQGAATVPPSHTATASEPPAGQQSQVPPGETLCRSLYSYLLTHEGQDWKSTQKAESPILQQLKTLARGERETIGEYCDQYVRQMFPHGNADSLGPGPHGLQELVPVDPGQNAQDMKPGGPAPPPATNAPPPNG